MPPFEFKFDSTPELARQATRLMIWRRAGWWIVLMCLALVALIILLVSGSREWYLYVALGIGLSKLYAWCAYYKKSAKPFSELGDPTVNVRVDEVGINMQLETGNATIKWEAPINLYLSRELWLLGYFSDRTYTVFPASCMSEEVQEFMKRKIVENGGKLS